MHFIYSRAKRAKLRRLKLSEYEYNITKLLLDNLNVDIESDSTLLNPETYMTLYCGNTPYVYSSYYTGLADISSEKGVIFRPLKYDKHANVLIDLFEELNIIDSDMLNIIEEEDEDGIKTYKGFFSYKGHKVKGSFTYNTPSTAILKTFIVAKLLLDGDDYQFYMKNLNHIKDKLKGGNKNGRKI